MSNFNISILSNKIFSEIVREIKLFSEYEIKYYSDIDLWIKDSKKENQIVVLFENFSNKDKINNFPSILITKSSEKIKKSALSTDEFLKMPFKILDFEKKIISVLAKHEFKRNSLILLSGYTIDKNERKIKKNNLELQLSEKEIDFLILFSKSNNPINRNLVLKKVWKYSDESETHTVETHIHRLRKKILEKFGDKNFIKNNEKGYYI
tara:strand:+ start:495 stop:1118 length:624 start_codon:yes stop_codon:yes gene_type:complete